MLQVGDRVMLMTAAGDRGFRFGVVDRFCNLGRPTPAARVLGHSAANATVPLRFLAEVPKPMTQAWWAAMPAWEQRAYVERRGVKIGGSTFIDDETITYGWGRLDEFGSFEYPCPWAAPSPSEKGQ